MPPYLRRQPRTTNNVYSPRVILVENHGALAGLVTVKDVLRFTMTEHDDRHSPWNEQRFDGVVDEAVLWGSDAVDRAWAWCRGRLGRH